MLPLKEFQEIIKKEVLGQDKAVNVLTTAMYKYIMKLFARDFGQRFTGASSVLLIGNTGTGKTHLVRTLADKTDLPFIEVNAKSITQEGWHGNPFIDQIEQGIKQAVYDHGRAINGGIIFIDEFDKILAENFCSAGDDVNYHIQTGILKYIEGMELTTRSGQKINFNNWLFVFSGAFVGLKLEKEKENTIGFTGNKKKGDKILTKDALIEFGLLPEIAGRIQEVIHMKAISKKIYKNLLQSEYFCFLKWFNVLQILNVKLEYKPNKLIKKAIKSDLGVRGLIQAVEEEVTDTINKNINEIDLEKFTVLGVYNRTL